MRERKDSQWKFYRFLSVGCSKMYCCSDMSEEKFEFSAKGIQNDGNDISYEKFYDVLFEGKEDKVMNKRMRYINGYMKSYKQSKRGLSYVYHKLIVFPDGVTTKPLNV
jgi:hypothetical protein